MPTVVAERLRAHLAATGGVVSIDRFLFTGPKGAVIRYTNWRSRKWCRIVEQVGFDVLPHDLRHTVTTRLFVEDRWTVPEVQAYMGHLDPKVTLRIYTHIAAAELPRPSSSTGNGT